MKAIVGAGLCDPGAGGPQARLARLPVGVNGKREPAFTCRCITWSPQRRYSVEELIEGLGLQAPSADRPGEPGSARRRRTRMMAIRYGSLALAKTVY